jgi:hypothetical protein
MWKLDFCMFLLGTSSGSEVHQIVIEVGEYQCVAEGYMMPGNM